MDADSVDVNPPSNTITEILEIISFPYTLINLLITVALFSMYTAIAMTNNGFNGYMIFLLLLLLFGVILTLLLSRNRIIFHSMLLYLILFMASYTYLPLFIIKNPSPNNYITLISTFSVVAAVISYYNGYFRLIELAQNPERDSSAIPNTESLRLIKKTPRNATIQNLSIIIVVSLIYGFVSDLFVLGCIGPSYLPNYVINANIDVCSRPSKQTFKCSMFKDGQLVSSATTLA